MHRVPHDKIHTYINTKLNKCLSEYLPELQIGSNVIVIVETNTYVKCYQIHI